MDVTISFKIKSEILTGKIIGIAYCDNIIIGYAIRGDNRKDYPLIKLCNIITINGKCINEVCDKKCNEKCSEKCDE